MTFLYRIKADNVFMTFSFENELIEATVDYFYSNLVNIYKKTPSARPVRRQGKRIDVCMHH